MLFTVSEPTGEDRPVKRAKTTQQLAQDGNEDSSHSSSEESESTSESEKDSTSSSSSESSSSSSESTTESESESESGSASSTSRSSEPLSKQTTQLRQSLSSHPRSLISSRPTNERLRWVVRSPPLLFSTCLQAWRLPVPHPSVAFLPAKEKPPHKTEIVVVDSLESTKQRLQVVLPSLRSSMLSKIPRRITRALPNPSPLPLPHHHSLPRYTLSKSKCNMSHS